MSKTSAAKYVCNFFLLFFAIYTGQADGTCKYLSEVEKHDGIMELLFEKATEDNITSCIVGFRFNESVKNFTIVVLDRLAIKASDKLWFVHEKQPNIIELVRFYVQVRYGKATAVTELSFNGKIICTAKDQRLVPAPSEGPDVLNPENTEKYAVTGTFVTVIATSLIQGSLLIIIILLVIKLEKLTCKKWLETFSLALSIDRSVSLNNPNRNNVPLPNPPGHIPPSVNNASTYLDLQNYQCYDPRLRLTYGFLLEVLQKLDYTTMQALQIDPERYKSIRLKSFDQNINIKQKEDNEKIKKKVSQEMPEQDIESSL